jgi:hypothetical protein
MKELIGKEFEGGKVNLSLDKSKVKLEAEYDLMAVALPLLKDKIVAKIKEAIPGKIDDAILDKVMAELEEELKA